MYSVEDRERVRDWIVQLSREDTRLIAGALIGSTAQNGGDQWSDLDLTFGLADGVSMDEVLADWKARFEREFNAVHLFDLPYLTTTYRVFLLPDNLQVDISFTPGNRFLGYGLKYNSLFGQPLEKERAKPPSADHAFGLAVVYLLHARACVARGRVWEAEYSINAARDQALLLACLHRGLKTSYGRGFDELSSEILGSFSETLVGSLNQHSLLVAISKTLDALLQNSQDVQVASRLAPQLREALSSPIKGPEDPA